MKILDELKGRGIKPGLETIAALLRRLGDPQLSFRSVHIAGTNGKGSVASMLREMLVRAGFKTALYTSPHLHRFSERIVINHEEIPEADIERLEDEVAKALSGLEPTYFEFTTAMAFMYFAEQKPDIAVIEVGLGGRLDATNLVDSLVAVITPLSIDHPEFLGPDIRSMAYEKAGIIKPGRPVVVSRQPPEAVELITNTAASLDAPLYMEGRDFSAGDEKYPAFNFRGRRLAFDKLRCGLLGRRQAQNSAVALAAAEVIEEAGFKIGEQAMREGVRNVRWPARMELIATNPQIVIDGAHNVGGALVLSREMPEEFPGKPAHLLMGMQVTKDLSGFIETLAPAIAMVHAVPIREVQCFSPDQIAAQAHKAGLPSRAYGSVREGLDGAMAAAKKDKGIVLAAGSLYLAGEVGELVNDGA